MVKIFVPFSLFLVSSPWTSSAAFLFIPLRFWITILHLTEEALGLTEIRHVLVTFLDTPSMDKDVDHVIVWAIQKEFGETSRRLKFLPLGQVDKSDSTWRAYLISVKRVVKRQRERKILFIIWPMSVFYTFF